MIQLKLFHEVFSFAFVERNSRRYLIFIEHTSVFMFIRMFSLSLSRFIQFLQLSFSSMVLYFDWIAETNSLRLWSIHYLKWNRIKWRARAHAQIAWKAFFAIELGTQEKSNQKKISFEQKLISAHESDFTFTKSFLIKIQSPNLVP